MTVNDVAAFFSVSKNLVRKNIRRGILPAFVNANGEFEMLAADVLGWLRGRQFRGKQVNPAKLGHLERIVARAHPDLPPAA